MQTDGMTGEHDLYHHGLQYLGRVYRNLTPAALIEQIILRGEAVLSRSGAVVVNTGKHTGRSPNDKFSVNAGLPASEIWWGKTNQPIDQIKFEQVLHKIRAYLQGRDVFVQDLQAGAHPEYKVPIRIITEKAWAALFSSNLFINLPPDELVDFKPQYTIFHCPDFRVDPAFDSTKSSTLIAIDFTQNTILIAGTSYAGEIKKSIFTVMNYILPRTKVLSMHCAANLGKNQDVALFFGLSGTGKTTLSSDPDRLLIGDDEHGWADDGVFNFEGGCYAKTIHLRPELEPLIWTATQSFGSVLENVTCDPVTRSLDFDDDHRTENTRGAYPISFIKNSVASGRAGHPTNIFFLTADAFGIFPPIARLDIDQAMYYFLSGYTSKLAGTETGLGAEPQATFSTCFGAPFLPLHPKVYADLLGQKLSKHKAQVWLVNTGWTGGPYGTGHRIRLPLTRAMIRAVLSGALHKKPFHKDPFFGFSIPDECPDVPTNVLNPQSTWSDPEAFEANAEMLTKRFVENFEQFKGEVPESIIKAGPQLRKLTSFTPAD